MEEKKQKILNFLKKEQLMVLSTMNEKEMPQCAVVGFTETPALEIIFGTLNTTRKWKNLQHHKEVALVIGWNLDEKITIQYEGVAEEVRGKKREECKRLHIGKIPKREKFMNNLQESMFKIKPRWIRYSDLSKEKDEIFEIHFE